MGRTKYLRDKFLVGSWSWDDLLQLANYKQGHWNYAAEEDQIMQQSLLNYEPRKGKLSNLIVHILWLY